MSFGAAIRDQWTLDPEVAFLNNGSFGACPRPVLAAYRALQDALERQPVRWTEEAMPKIRAALEPVGDFLGAKAENLVFVENATSGINAVVRSLDFGPDDAILTTTHAYGAVAQTLRFARDRSGARLIEVAVPFPIAGPEQVVEAVRAALTDRVKLVVLDHVSSITGLIYPVEELISLCRAVGAMVLIDGAHAPGLLPLDIEALGADFYVGNLHKWLFTPKGCAVLYVAPEHADAIHPTAISHGYGAGLHAEFDWVGTRDLAAWLAVPAAVDFMTSLGADAVRSYNNALCAEAAAMLAEAWDVAIPSPPALRAALCTLPPPLHIPPRLEAAAEMHLALRHLHRIEVPCMPFGDRSWLRITAQVFNTMDDYVRLAEAVGPDGVR